MSSDLDSHGSEGETAQPLRPLIRFGVVAVISVVLGAILPGAVAYKDGVFYQDSMDAKVLAAIDARTAAGKASDREVNLRKTWADDLREPPRGKTWADVLDPPPSEISVQPFYMHLIMYFWPTIYFGLGSVAFVMNPSLGRQAWRVALREVLLNRWRVKVGIAAAVFAIQTAPIIFRNLYVTDFGDGRRVFAYSNFDVDSFSFAIQLFNFAIFSALLSIVWVHWSFWTVQCRRRLHRDTHEVPIVAAVEQLSATLRRWQVTFALITPGFVIYTGIFWEQIIVSRDFRFIVEAITAHALWLITGIVLFAPFSTSWRIWGQLKRRIIAAFLTEDVAAETITAKLEALDKIEPVGFWNAATSTIATLLSFVAPLVEALLKASRS